jgi:hypothetical protein
VFDTFTNTVGMVNTILQELVVFMFILFYFFLSTGVLMMFLNPHYSYKRNIANAYVFSLFGGIEGTDFSLYPFITIPIVFGTIMISIMLLNILIAFLSELFSRLEDKQKSDNLKEKAQMILDVEMIKYFFKRICKKKINKQNGVNAVDNNNKSNTLQNEEENKFKDPPELEKYLYIVAPFEFEDMIENTVDDNIYRKVKEQSQTLKRIQRKITNQLNQIEEKSLQKIFKVQKSINSIRKLINKMKK